MFNKVEFEANRLLDTVGCTELPIDIHDVAIRCNYNIKSYGSCKSLIKKLSLEKIVQKYLSVSFLYDSTYYLLLSDKLTKDEERKLIAHEIGHIRLHNLVDCGIAGVYEHKAHSETQESEADAFALHLLAPLPLLSNQKIKDPSSIRELTGLSLDDCRIVFENLSEYRDQGRVINSRNRLLERSRKTKKTWFSLKHLPSFLLCVAFALIGLLCYLFGSSTAHNSAQDLSAAQSTTAADSSREPAPTNYVTFSKSEGTDSDSCHPERSEGSLPPSPTEETVENDALVVSSDSAITTYYWTDSGTVYHSFDSCQSLKNSTEIRSGTLTDAQSTKPRLCKFCGDKLH